MPKFHIKFIVQKMIMVKVFTINNYQLITSSYLSIIWSPLLRKVKILTNKLRLGIQVCELAYCKLANPKPV